MANPKVKICGITRSEDYRSAVELGANYTGFIFYPPSPRYISPEQAAELIRTAPRKHHSKVGVFVNEAMERVREVYHVAELDIVQLHGDESPEYVAELDLPVWKVLRVKDARSLDVMKQYSCDTFLLDTFQKGTYGGTGKTFEPAIAEQAAQSGKRIIVSGGVSGEHLSVLARLDCSFYAVDVNSSLEDEPGLKSVKKMKQFFRMFNQTFEMFKESGLSQGSRRFS
jgi:phosphoribosylanthranilate isomerase